MTEKEFENLKVGDKVWIITDWLGTIGEGMKAHQKEVAGKDEDKHDIQCIGCSLVSDHCYLSKAEAWEAEVKEYENAVKAEEEYLAKKRQTLERYKSELAKAKEEEEKAKKIKPYYVTYLTGKVEKYPFVLDGYEYTTHFTEQEAYEALAEYYKRKLFKTLEKCGYKFAICCDKNIAVVKIDKDRGDIWWCYYYPHLSYGSVRKTNVFDTLEEAEAQLKREKDGD